VTSSERAVAAESVGFGGSLRHQSGLECPLERLPLQGRAMYPKIKKGRIVPRSPIASMFKNQGETSGEPLRNLPSLLITTATANILTRSILDALIDISLNLLNQVWQCCVKTSLDHSQWTRTNDSSRATGEPINLTSKLEGTRTTPRRDLRL
jgi:hypothetical protein